MTELFKLSVDGGKALIAQRHSNKSGCFGWWCMGLAVVKALLLCRRDEKEGG